MEHATVEPSPAPPTTTPEELALAASELAELVEHHRRELVDTMAELTRLQRVLRAETRAAIEAIRAAAAGLDVEAPERTGDAAER